MDYRMNSLRVDFLTVGFSWELPGELTNLNLSGFFFLGLTERGIFAVKHGRFLGQNISCTSKYVDFNRKNTNSTESYGGFYLQLGNAWYDIQP